MTMISKSYMCALSLLVGVGLWAQTPNLVNGAGGDVFPGTQDCFDLTLTNTGSPGYAPYIRLILPPEISLDSAAFLGSGVTTTTIGTFPAAPGNELTDPRSGTTLSGPEGHTLVLLILPVGSIVEGGPPIVIDTCVTVDESTDIGVTLNVDAQAVYEFGNSPTGSTPIESVVQTGSYFTTLYTMTKSNDAPEGENPPGAPGVFQNGFTITVDVAPNKTIHDIVITDTLDSEMQYLGPVIIVGGVNCTADVEPSTLTPGGTLVISCDSITGGSGDDLTITYPATYIIDTLDETNCSTYNVINNVTMDAEYPDDTSLPQTSDITTISAEHVVLRKGASPGTANPGDTITFTLNYAVTNYGTCDNLVITDILPDGYTFAAHQSHTGGAITPFVSVDGFGVTTIIYDVTAVTGNLGPASTGSITYTATIDQIYTATGEPVLAADSLTNQATADYGLLEGAIGCTNDSSATVNIAPIAIEKTLLNPQSEYLPGEIVVFRLSMTVPSGDTSAIVFEDFFPLPVFDVTSLNLTYGNDIVAAPIDTVGAIPSSITVDSGENSLRIEWPDINSTATETLAVDISIQIESTPFADNLFLTNLFQATTENTPGATAAGIQPVSIRVRAPELEITKGVSASDNATADATISPSPAVTPVDGDISASDAGDTITYTLTVLNEGGAPAFDVVVSDPAITELTNPTLVSVENDRGLTLATSGSLDTGLTLTAGLAQNRAFFLEGHQSVSLFTDGGTVGTPDPGDVLQYTLDILANDGNHSNALLNVNVPGNTSYVPGSLQSNVGSVNEAGLPGLFVDLGSMNEGDRATVTFRTIIDAGTNGMVISSQGTLNSDETLAELTDAIGNDFDGDQIHSLTVGTPLGPQIGQPDELSNTALVTVSYDLAGSVQPEQVIENIASVTWASGSGSPSFPAESDTAQVTIASPLINKSVTAIAPGYAGNLNQVQIGEVITYQVVITLPEGTSQNVTFSDLVDNGLALTDVVSITPSSGDVTTDVGGGFPGILAGAVFTNSGAGSHQLDRLLTLDFGNVTNANTDDATAETITIVYRARVLNWTDNDRGDSRNNRARWIWDNPNAAGTVYEQDNAPNVTIIEPELQVVKTLSAATGDAGDTLTVTLDISHTGASNADAFDVTLEDVLPTGFTFASGFTTGGIAPSAGPAHSLGTVTASWDSFSNGSTAQITFTVTIDSTVEPTENIENCADVLWQSLATADEGALPNTPNNTLGVERTGNPADTGGAANDYTDQACDDIDVPQASVAKSVDSISPGGASPNVTSGDTVTYRLTVTLPEPVTWTVAASTWTPENVPDAGVVC